MTFTLLVGLGSLVAGFLGALTGLGGGVVIVPMLTLAFGVDIRYAIGASLVSVIATSSGAAAAYVREGYSNIRIGMFLEMATTRRRARRRVAGRHRSDQHASPSSLASCCSSRPSLPHGSQPSGRGRGKPDRLATRCELDGTFPTPSRTKSYHVTAFRRVRLMFVAGLLSGLLGIGSGAVKVLAMDQAMRLPFKVSTTTSNFMIGVTAAASAGIYLSRGYIDPGLAMPVMLGVGWGRYRRSSVCSAVPNVRVLRLIFGLVILALASK